jgi:tRNA A-37 threonylcarbamoyl transferase component Bud32
VRDGNRTVAAGPRGERDLHAALKIFINYRHDDATFAAHRLYEDLAKHFGDDNVFIDVNIPPGVDWEKEIQQQIGSCDVFIATIGRHWLALTDARGNRRIDNEHDPCRVEIQNALDDPDVRVIPALLSDAEPPTPDQLPAGLEELTKRQAIRLNEDLRWNDDVALLVRGLQRLAEQLGRERREGGVTVPADAPRDLVGQQIDGYRLERMLGHGGLGDVYLAEHLVLRQERAVKVLRAELAGDPEIRKRFLVEPRLAAELEHPNIIDVYDAAESPHGPYIAMRYVENDLERLLEQRGPLPPDQTLSLLEQAAAALDEAHAHGLVHRDVKPANILIDSRDHVFVSDFGAAARLASRSGGGGMRRSTAAPTSTR